MNSKSDACKGLGFRVSGLGFCTEGLKVFAVALKDYGSFARFRVLLRLFGAPGHSPPPLPPRLVGPVPRDYMSHPYKGTSGYLRAI